MYFWEILKPVDAIAVTVDFTKWIRIGSSESVIRFKFIFLGISWEMVGRKSLRLRMINHESLRQIYMESIRWALRGFTQKKKFAQVS